MEIQLYQAPPARRTNRRRERPGARTRRSATRKNVVQFDVAEGLDLARGFHKLPPFESAAPSPLRRQTVDQSWQRWQTREAEQEAATAEMTKRAEIEREQRRLFGGDVDDDELRQMGILYDESSDLKSESITGDISEPLLNFRTRPRGRQRRRPAQTDLPLFLYSSFLSQDPEIMRLMASRTPSRSDTISIKTSAASSRSHSPQSLPSARNAMAHISSSPLLFPLAGDDEELADATWTVISSIPCTPSFESETWVDLGDDLQQAHPCTCK